MKNTHYLSETLAEGIQNFLDDLDAHDYRIHALMIAYGDEVVYQSAAQPYTLDTPHRLFSAAKSILVLNVMKAMQEGRLKSTDRIASLFPEYHITDPGILKMAVEDLLTMRTGQEEDPFGLLFQNFDTDLFEAFFQAPTVEEPGRRFRYNNTVPHLVYGVAERIAKEPFEELQNRSFCDPMDAPLLAPTNSKGQYNPVITCTSARTFMKYAQLFLNEGTYQGTRYIQPELIREATRKHTDTGLNSDAGYGWQIWLNQFGGYRMDGGWGQYAILLPEYHAAIVVMSDMTDSTYLLKSFEKILLPVICKDQEEQGRRDLPQTAVQIPQLRSLAPQGNAAGSDDIFGRIYEGEGISIELQKMEDGSGVKLVQNGKTYKIGAGEFAENAGYSPREFSIDHSVYGTDSDTVFLAGAWSGERIFEMKGKCLGEMGETYCRLTFEEERCIAEYTPLSIHGISERSIEERKEVVLWHRKN